MKRIKPFSAIRINDISIVGGKNASLGEMYSSLSSKGIMVPNGFAVTADGYWQFLKENQLEAVVGNLLAELNVETFDNLSKIALEIRTKILEANFPKSLEKKLQPLMVS